MRVASIFGPVAALFCVNQVSSYISQPHNNVLLERGSYSNPVPRGWAVEDFQSKALAPAAQAPADRAIKFRPSYIASVYIQKYDPILCIAECDYFNNVQAHKSGGKCGRSKCNFINIYTLNKDAKSSPKYVCAFFQSGYVQKDATLRTMSLDRTQYSVKYSVGISRRPPLPVDLTCWKNNGLAALCTMPAMRGISAIPTAGSTTSASRTSTTSTRRSSTKTSTRTTTKTSNKPSTSTISSTRSSSTSTATIRTTSRSNSASTASTTSLAMTTATTTTSESLATAITTTTTTTSSSLSTTSSSSSSSTTSTTTTTTSSNIEAPSATVGDDFDLRIDEQLGFMNPETDIYYKQLFPGIDLSEDNNKRLARRVLAVLAPLFTDVNHRNMPRGWFSKIVKAVAKVVVAVVTAPIRAVVKVIVALLPPVDKTIRFGIPFKFGPPSWLPDGALREEDGYVLFKAEIPEKKVDAYKEQNKILKDREYKNKMKFQSNIGAEFGLYCKDCYLDTKFDISGHIAWDSNGMKALSLGFGGPMTLNLGLVLKAEGFYNPVLRKQLKKINLSTWRIPLILSVGPAVTFNAGWEVDLRGYVSLKPTFTLNWNNFGAVAVIVGPAESRRYLPDSAGVKFAIEAGASLATNIFLEAEITAGVDITAIGTAAAGVYIRGGMGFGLSVKQEWNIAGEEKDGDSSECNGVGLYRQWFFDATIKAQATAKPLHLGYGKDIPLFKTTKTLQPSTCFPWSTTKAPVITSTAKTTSTITSQPLSSSSADNPNQSAAPVGNLVQNGDFGRNDFNGWEINQSGGTANIEPQGLFGASYKAVAAVRAGNPYSAVIFTQYLDTVPGKQYRLSIAGRFRDGNADCYCNVFINGNYVISKRSGSTDPFNETNLFTAGPEKSKLDIALTNTFYASMTYEIGNIKVELIS